MCSSTCGMDMNNYYCMVFKIDVSRSYFKYNCLDSCSNARGVT